MRTQSKWSFVLYVIIAVTTLIMAILTSFMLTEKGTKEHNWWVFLMCVSWIAFAGSLGVSGLSGYFLFRPVRGPSTIINNTTVQPQTLQAEIDDESLIQP